MQQLNVSLTDELNDLVRSLVAAGRYASASEVVRDSLRLMEEREQLRVLKLKELRQLIKEGKESPTVPYDFEGARREAQKRAEAMRSAQADTA